MRGNEIRTRGNINSLSFLEVRLFALLSTTILCQRVIDSFVLSEVIQIDDYIVWARMFSGLMTGISLIRVYDAFSFLVFLVVILSFDFPLLKCLRFAILRHLE